MKLIELVDYFRKGGTYEEFCQKYSLLPESEVVEIYTTRPLSINNDLAFFEIELTQGSVEYSVNGEFYFNLFDFYYFQDAIIEANYRENLSLSDAEIAQHLYDYAINNA